MNVCDLLILILTEKVNYLAVLVAAVANFAFGAIWYTPLMFAKAWSKEVFGDQPMDEIKQKAHVPTIMTLSFVMGIFQALGMAILLSAGGTAFHGALLGLFIGVIWLGTNLWKHSLFEMKSFKLVLINGGHDTIVFVIMGAILGAWH